MARKQNWRFVTRTYRVIDLVYQTQVAKYGSMEKADKRASALSRKHGRPFLVVKEVREPIRVVDAGKKEPE